MKRAKPAIGAAAKGTGKRGGKHKGKARGELWGKVARRSGGRSEVEVEGQGVLAWRAPEAHMLHSRSS